MKKIFLLSVCCIGQCAFAQKSFFGVDAGVNVANQRMVSTLVLVSNPPINQTSVVFGFNTLKPTFGFFYEREFIKNLAVRLNAQYMGLGYKNKGNIGVSVDINYLTFPLNFRYYINKNLSIQAGPYLSFTLGGTQLNNQDITKTYHKNDFGFSIGAEQDVYKNISLSVNYFIGTKNIILQDEVQNPTIGNVNRKYTNRALQFTLIYKFKKTN